MRELAWIVVVMAAGTGFVAVLDYCTTTEFYRMVDGWEATNMLRTAWPGLGL